jgi:hypothetical protein
MAAYDDYAVKLDASRRIAPDDSEYWMARDLQPLLGYKRWEDFAEAVRRGMEACASANLPVENHFRQTPRMVNIGSGVKRATEDWFLSRSACYLIAMNADSSKEEVAYAQTYFTIQTRRQEQADQLTAVERRRELRRIYLMAMRNPLHIPLDFEMIKALLQTLLPPAGTAGTGKADKCRNDGHPRVPGPRASRVEQSAEAKPHLDWVLENGNRDYSEYQVLASLAKRQRF